MFDNITSQFSLWSLDRMTTKFGGSDSSCRVIVFSFGTVIEKTSYFGTSRFGLPVSVIKHSDL